MAEAMDERALLPMAEGTIVFSGIGASAYALTPAVLTLRAGGCQALEIAPGELAAVRAAGIGDAFVLVSQSGASTEMLGALEYLEGTHVIAISARGESPLAQAADTWLPLGPLPETEVATLSYTATLQALGMLCDAVLRTSSGWEDLPALATEVLEGNEPIVNRVAHLFAGVRAIDAVGAATARASAGETALLAREGLRLPAAGMETREYLHGPLEAVSSEFGCVLFGGEREAELAAELASFGARTLLLTDEPRRVSAGIEAIEIPHVADIAAPILQILPIQLLVDDIARLRGLQIGKLRRKQPDTKVA